MEDNSVIIIGGGSAGLSAGIYAQMNGYRTQIFEMHNLPGGLCTAWKRKGYTIDGCIHWLVGSSPRSGMYRYWEEVGIAKGREFINMDEYMRYESADKRTLILYTNVDRLEKHLLEFSPQDAEPIRDFIKGIRMFLDFDQPSESDRPLKRLQKGLKLGLILATKGREMRKWMKITTAEFVMRFKDPALREALREMWFPEFSMFFMFFTFAHLHNRNAGYPIGGSLPMSLALAKRYTANWKGSFEGWLLTPQNLFTVMNRMRQTLPGLQNFYMCGQWVEPGGGLPTSVMSGRRLVQAMCKQDGKKFQTKVA